MKEQKAISPQLRAAKFVAMTRENIQTLPAIAAVENASVSFNLPKARLLAKLQLLVEAEVRVAHATAASFTPAVFAPYNLLRRVQMDFNNGFSAYRVSGAELYMYNMLHFNAHTFERSTTDPNATVFMQTGASAGGTINKIKFIADMPVALNDRDPIGLVMLQNEETVVTIVVDVDSASKLLADASGYTVELVSMSITPVVQTFTIPANPEAMPDLSILKLVHSMRKEILGAGLTTIKLPVGLTYRKLFFYIEDVTGGVGEDKITTDFEIMFNQADIPYKINPKILRAQNIRSFGKVLPVGMYAFDFSDQGITNYGGARDYINTERLTEFWLQFGTANPGTIYIVYEVLSRLAVV